MASTTVSYDGKKLEPVSTLSIEKVYQVGDDGTTIGTEFIITILLVLIFNEGSPRSKLDGAISDTGFGGVDNAFWITSGYATKETITEDQRFAALYRKQEYVRRLFSTKGLSFEYQSGSGDAPVKCNPHGISVQVQDGIHNFRSNVIITLRANRLLTATGLALDEDNFNKIYISTANEGWAIETDINTPQSVLQNRTYRLAHTISAKGKEEYNSSTGLLEMPAWKQARKWVHARMGFDNSFLQSSGVPDLPLNSQGYNRTNSENIDEIAGTYSVTENWILATHHCLEDFNVRSSFSIDDGLHNVAIEGTITGLELRNSPIQTPADVQRFMNSQSGVLPVIDGWFDRFPYQSGEANALSSYIMSQDYNPVDAVFTPSGNVELYDLWVAASGATSYINAVVSGCLMEAVSNMHDRAQSYSGWPLNPIPVNYAIGRNPTTGIVTYSYNYNDRPSNFIANALSEKITITHNHPADIIAVIPIIGRATSLLQSMNTKTQRTKTLTIEVVLPIQTNQARPVMPGLGDILAYATPGVGVTPPYWQVFKTEDRESMSFGNRYTREIVWTYEI